MTANVFSFRDQARRSSKIKQIKKKFYFYSYLYIIFELRNLQITALDSLSNISLLFILYVFHHNQLLKRQNVHAQVSGPGLPVVRRNFRNI